MCWAAASFCGAAAADEPNGRVVLVLPFDNRSGQMALNWIGDSFPETLNQRLTSAGYLTISRDDRLFALDHLGYPLDLKPTRATALRIAQTLDADVIVIGNFTVQNGRLQAQAQVLEVNALKMSRPLDDSTEMARLLDVENAVAWKTVREIDPKFPVAEHTFLAASAGDNLEAFESYVRGVTAITPAERLKRLQTAVQQAPQYAAALLALGKAQYAQGLYEQSAETLKKVPEGSRFALEANFYLGLAQFNSGHYSEAESAFAFIASRMPLPEVVSNQGVAASRQGKESGALFQRASAADPQDADYHYNLAVALWRRKDADGAKRELAQVQKLKPNDSDATQLMALVTSGGQPTGDFQPLERVRRTYSETGFRQAAFEMEQMNAARTQSLPAEERASALTKQGQAYMAQGLVLEAEREFQNAIAMDNYNAVAHAGLAQVRERAGDLDAARSEAQSSVNRTPNVDAYLVLARIDLQQNDLVSSAADVAKALKLEPANGNALGMKQALAARGTSLP